MKPIYVKWLVVGVAVIVLFVINFTIYQREKLLEEGQMVLLELAPVDPRSLLQGDYMALDFLVARKAFADQDLTQLKDGRLVLALNEKGIAIFQRFDDEETELSNNEFVMQYRIRNNRPKFATNAFFFQEGDSEKYEEARYGEFRVSEDGTALLNTMRDKDLKILGMNRP